MREQTTSSNKFTLDLIISWIFGGIFALTGIISIGMKIVVIIIGYIIFGATIDTFNVPITQQNKLQKEEQQTKVTHNIAIKQQNGPQKEEQQTKVTHNIAVKQQNEPQKEEQQTASITDEIESNKNNNQDDKKLYPVVKVVDGDTIDVEIDGKKERIRLIGVDTPETVDPRKPVQCFGKEASNNTKQLLTDKYVYLESDPVSGNRDKYNRLLRYIILKDGTNFNKLIIEQGFAHEYTYNSIPYKYQAEFKQAEKEARKNKRGLWADGICKGNNTTEQTDPVLVSPTNQNDNQNCKCSSNIYNCSDFKTHAEAQTLFECCGGTQNDIHKLDRDKDGLACETLP